jgi:hypothetical protein
LLQFIKIKRQYAMHHPRLVFLFSSNTAQPRQALLSENKKRLSQKSTTSPLTDVRGAPPSKGGES